MGDRPDAAELVEAVFEFLAEEVLPNVSDHRQKFRTLVAMNALGIARRELEAGAASSSLLQSPSELADLARRIRAGDPPDDALSLLKEHVAAKLRISNPGYLDRYG
jgi:hypothetical protein